MTEHTEYTPIPKAADDYSYIAAKLKEIAAERDRAINPPAEPIVQSPTSTPSGGDAAYGDFYY